MCNKVRREARRSIQFQLDYDIRINHRNAIKGRALGWSARPILIIQGWWSSVASAEERVELGLGLAAGPHAVGLLGELGGLVEGDAEGLGSH